MRRGSLRRQGKAVCYAQGEALIMKIRKYFCHFSQKSVDFV